MPTRISINIGVNTPSGQVSGPKRTLTESENDARLMYSLAAQQGFRVDSPYGLLVGKDASLDAVRASLKSASAELKAGDLLLLTFSGHSCKLDDLNDDEADNFDEAWCLADLPMIDDEFHWWLAQFAPQVRILMILDTCFSDGGDALTRWVFDQLQASRDLYAGGSGLTGATTASIAGALLAPPPESDFNREIQEKYPRGRQVSFQASALMLASCAEGEESQNGLFTRAIYDTMQGGSAPTTYAALYIAVCNAVLKENGLQHPKLRPIGVPDIFFFSGPPFQLQDGSTGAMRSAPCR
jgi:hypothetical protein